MRIINKMLLCDINLGGSTEQFLSYGRRNYSRLEYVSSIKAALLYRAKTKPAKMARRLGCLLGVTYDLLDGDEYILDCIIEAFKEIEKELNQ